MPEHVRADVIPPGLKKRWEEFGQLSRECWEKVGVLDLPAGEAFTKFFACMSSKGAHLMSVEEARRYGVAAHPIAVRALMEKGLTEEEAEKQAIEEGKFHGVSLMRAEIELAKERGEL